MRTVRAISCDPALLRAYALGLAVLVACGNEAQSATSTATNPVAATTTPRPAIAAPVNEPVAAPQSAEPSAEVAAHTVAPTPSAAASLPNNGLAAFTRGSPILLRSLHVTERQVGGMALPTVALPNAATQARLDQLIADAGMDTLGCDIPLATETLVALRCLADRSNQGRGVRGGDRIRHFRIGPTGEIEAVPLLDFFHPGLEERALTSLLLHTPEASPHYAVFTSRGLELNSAHNVVAEPAVLSYRQIAPYVRADSPLGAILAERNIPLAPAGIQMPPLPEHVRGVWATNIAHLPAVINGWSSLPTELQAQVRLVTPYGDNAAGLLFPPSIDAASAVTLVAPFRNLGSLFGHEGYWTAAGSEITWMRTAAFTEVHERPDSAANIVARLPANTFLPTINGNMNVAVSDPARGWAYVGQSPEHRGWVRSNALLPIGNACVPPNLPPQGLQAILRGTSTWRRDGQATSIAWYVSKYQGRLGYQLEIAPLDGCTVGTARVIEMRNEPNGFYFASSTAGGVPDLLLVLHGQEAAIYGAEGALPIYSTRLAAAQVVEVNVTGEAHGIATYFPVRLGTSPQPTALVWTGTTLEPSRP